MRAFTDDSVKLNRDLQRYIERALEEGRPIKIGWGQAGDENQRTETLESLLISQKE